MKNKSIFLNATAQLLALNSHGVKLFCKFAFDLGEIRNAGLSYPLRLHPNGKESYCAKQKKYQMGYWSRRVIEAIRLKRNSSKRN